MQTTAPLAQKPGVHFRGFSGPRGGGTRTKPDAAGLDFAASTGPLTERRPARQRQQACPGQPRRLLAILQQRLCTRSVANCWVSLFQSRRSCVLLEEAGAEADGEAMALSPQAFAQNLLF